MYTIFEVIKMIIYKIYARDKKVGDMVIISPSACNTDKEEMTKIAKRMKYEMSDLYDKVIIKTYTYELKTTDFIEV